MRPIYSKLEAPCQVCCCLEKRATKARGRKRRRERIRRRVKRIYCSTALRIRRAWRRLGISMYKCSRVNIIMIIMERGPQGEGFPSYCLRLNHLPATPPLTLDCCEATRAAASVWQTTTRAPQSCKPSEPLAIVSKTYFISHKTKFSELTWNQELP